MPTIFDGLDLKRAQALVGTRALDEGGQEARDFYRGDHWRDGQGWIGQRPGGEQERAMLAAIAAGFVSKNVAAEVVNRHRDAVLGREPRWGFVPRRPLAEGEEPTEPEQALADEAGAALTEWWDARRPLETVQRAVALALTTGRATLRLYVPAGLRDQAGKVSAPDLVAALGLIRPHLPEPGTAGVFPDGDLEGVEAETGAEVGVYAISRNNQESAELCYLDEQGGTVLRVVGEGGGEGGGEAAALPLGGRLLLYELTRDALLTPQVRQLQKALNLDLTQMMRNVNLAGSLERVIVNAQKPGEDSPVAHRTVVAALHKRSASAAINAVVAELRRRLVDVAATELADQKKAAPKVWHPDPDTSDTWPGLPPLRPLPPLFSGHESLAFLLFAVAMSGFFALQLRLGRYFAARNYILLAVEFIVLGWMLFRASGARLGGESMAGNVLFAILTGMVCLAYFLHAVRKKYLLRATLLGLFLSVGGLVMLITGIALPSESASLLSSWGRWAFIPACISLLWAWMPPSGRRRRTL